MILKKLKSRAKRKAQTKAMMDRRKAVWVRKGVERMEDAKEYTAHLRDGSTETRTGREWKDLHGIA